MEYCFFSKLTSVVTTNKNGETILAAIPSLHRTKETHGRHNFVVNIQKTDNDGRILILDVAINYVNFVLIHL